MASQVYGEDSDSDEGEPEAYSKKVAVRMALSDTNDNSSSDGSSDMAMSVSSIDSKRALTGSDISENDGIFMAEGNSNSLPCGSEEMHEDAPMGVEDLRMRTSRLDSKTASSGSDISEEDDIFFEESSSSSDCHYVYTPMVFQKDMAGRSGGGGLHRIESGPLNPVESVAWRKAVVRRRKRHEADFYYLINRLKKIRCEGDLRKIKLDKQLSNLNDHFQKVVISRTNANRDFLQGVKRKLAEPRMATILPASSSMVGRPLPMATNRIKKLKLDKGKTSKLSEEDVENSDEDDV